MSTTPRYGHAPAPMRRRENSDKLCELGDFCWQVGGTGKRTLVVLIPSNGPSGRVYSRWTIDHENHCGASWSWDGNEHLPTLSPSLHAVGTWHGYVRSGQLVEA